MIRQLKISKSITNRESDSVEKYLQEISKIDMVSIHEETILAQKIKTGDQKALDKLVQANLRFVVSVAKQYQHQGMALPDLINEGNLGLIKGAQRFDESKGFKFISYAVWWIRQSILQALAEQARMVRLPSNKIGTSNRIAKNSLAFLQENEREPTTEELAEIMDLPEYEIDTLSGTSTHHSSLDSFISDSEELTFGDLMVDEDELADKNLIEESLKKEIDRSLRVLTKQQKEVIIYHFGLYGNIAISLEDIGLRIGLTRERVRQIKDSAIRKLQSRNNSKLLHTFLG